MGQKHPCCIDPSSNDEVATVGAKDGDEIEEGRKVETEKAATNETLQISIPATMIRPSPVYWTPFGRIDSKYKEIIEQRMAALFSTDCKGTLVSTHLRITGHS